MLDGRLGIRITAESLDSMKKLRCAAFRRKLYGSGEDTREKGLVNVVGENGREGCEVVAGRAEGGEVRRLEHVDMVNSFPGNIRAGGVASAGENYVPRQFLHPTDIGPKGSFTSDIWENMTIQWASHKLSKILNCWTSLVPHNPSRDSFTHLSDPSLFLRCRPTVYSTSSKG